MKTTTKLALVTALALLAPALVLATRPAGSLAQPPPRTKVKVGSAVRALSFAPIHIASAAGFFAEENLDVEEMIIAGTPAYAGLLSGELHAFATDPARVFEMAAKGDTKLLLVQKVLGAQAMDVVFSKAYAQKTGVTRKSPLPDRLHALRGGKWGTQSLGGGPHVMLAYLARRGGLNPERDMEVIALRTAPATLAATKNGQIDGYMLTAPNSLRAELEGWGIVMIEHGEVPEFIGIADKSLHVAAQYARSNPDVVRRMVRAIDRGRRLLHGDPEKAVAVLGKVFEREDPKLLDRSIRTLQRAYEGDSLLDQTAIDRSMKLYLDAGVLKAPVTLKEGAHWTNEYNTARR